MTDNYPARNRRLSAREPGSREALLFPGVTARGQSQAAGREEALHDSR